MGARGDRERPRSRGQGIAEFALVLPIALALIVGIMSIGLWVFYGQQVTNVAREAARFAAIHSSTAPCPTSGWRDPEPPPTGYREFPLSCDGPANPNDTYPWPKMTDHARGSLWGVAHAAVNLNACWSGYVDPSVVVPSPPADYSEANGFPQADNPPLESGTSNTFVQCTIAGTDPIASRDSLACGSRMTTAADDPASNIPFNQVTVYACMHWSPPLAGFLFIPENVTIRAVVTEVIHRQQ